MRCLAGPPRTEDPAQLLVRPPGDSDRSRARALPRVGIGELDLATVSSHRQRYRLSHNEHARNELGDSDFLRRIGAAAEAEGGRPHPTVAGLLMFGHDWRIAKELPNYFLDYRQQRVVSCVFVSRKEKGRV